MVKNHTCYSTPGPNSIKAEWTSYDGKLKALKFTIRQLPDE